MTARTVFVSLITVALSGCSQSAFPTSPSIAAAARLAISATESAGTSSGLDTSREGHVPFEGRLQGEFTFSPEAPPSTFANVAFTSVGGVATHLGRFTMQAPHRVDLATLPAQASGTFVLTAANGDTVTASFTGLGTPTATPGLFMIVETATITGGTGRFAGATGNFVIERSVDLVGLYTEGSIDGVISSPGAAKH